MFSHIPAQVIEQPDASPAALIISLISAAAALYAVWISKKALDYTKGEPLRAAQRSLNGELREKVTSLVHDVEELQKSLRFGRNIPEEPDSLEVCRAFLDDIANRRPSEADASRHRLTAVILRSLSMNWRSAAHQQRRIDEDVEHLAKRRAAGDAEDLTKQEKQVQEATRARDAAYLSVKEDAKRALDHLKGEISVLDMSDRGDRQN